MSLVATCKSYMKLPDQSGKVSQLARQVPIQKIQHETKCHEQWEELCPLGLR